MTRVLVIDDEPNLVKGYLEREGFSVVVASDRPPSILRGRWPQT